MTTTQPASPSVRRSRQGARRDATTAPRVPCASPLAMAPIALAALTLALASAATLAAPPAAGTSAAIAATRPAAAPGPVCSRVDVAPLVTVPVGKSTLVKPTQPIARILLGNPDNARAARPAETAPKKDEAAAKAPTAAPETRPGVAEVDVVLLAPTEIYLLGKSIGSTNVVMLDRTGACTSFDVVVGMDTAALQDTLRQLLPGEPGIRVSAAFDSIVLTGEVSDSEALNRAIDLATAYVRGDGKAGSARVVNMLQVGAPQQVMLEVKVAEVSKSLLDAFGIDFSRAYAPGDGSMVRFLGGIFGGATGLLGQISGTGPTGVPFSSVDAVVGGTVPLGGISGGNVTVTYDTQGRPTYTTTYGTVPGRNATNAQLNMQKTDGLVKVLAEPTVMAISGQTGSFLAGGKILIPVVQNNGGNGGSTVTLEEKEFGVSVKFTPTVLGGSRIHLRVRPEVSELNATGVQISAGSLNSVLPSFTSRKAETTVQLMDGQSFAIGGLIKNNTTTNIKAFPFLGELPVVGALFRSTQFQTDRSELVFVITPRLVKPLPPDYRLPTDNYTPPTRGELILQGRLEGKPPAKDDKAAADGAAPALPATKTQSPAKGGFDKE
ncbi:type II and III secretion system protein family protein [Roseateles chitosanitabidus]|jgi:pilus assembly protein CpaC|uniref:type II and III secretion system protein family protein n=1 Tax=Roseateles chitosanitabidus TaxID=65048 RepID=UPI0023544C59|nr:type II and III secretion system protein family protein [Roseateles chitosanitabidus]